MKSSRREFIRSAALTGAAFAFPSIIPSSVLGANSPSNTLNIAQIGCGRIGLTMDMIGFFNAKGSRVIAAADLDKRRLEYFRSIIARRYKMKNPQSVIGATDYHDLLSNKDIDAFSISTPDH